MSQRISEDANNAIVGLIFSKGDGTNFQKYRPMSLLSQFFKLITRITCDRITAKLDEYLTVEQDGFRN